jgi:hypothetical protein
MTNLNADIVRNLLESKAQFPIEFNDAWEWLGFQEKYTAKSSFESCLFIKGLDFMIYPYQGYTSTTNLGVTKHLYEDSQAYRDSFDKISHLYLDNAVNGDIYLTLECFKSWGMMLRSETGRKVRSYFLQCEKLLKRTLESKIPNTPQVCVPAINKNDYYIGQFEAIERSKLANSVKLLLQESLTADLKIDHVHKQRNHCEWTNGELIRDFVRIIKELEREAKVGGWNVQYVDQPQKHTKIVHKYMAVILVGHGIGVWEKIIEKYPNIPYKHWNISEYVDFLGGIYSVELFDENRNSHRMIKKDCLLIPLEVDYSNCILSALKPDPNKPPALTSAYYNQVQQKQLDSSKFDLR